MTNRVKKAATLQSAWTSIGAMVGGISIWLGSGYAVAGKGATQAPAGWYYISHTWGLRTHGVIMVILGAWLLLQLGHDYTRPTIWVIRIMRTYSIIVALCWFASWFRFGVSWSAPAWWVLLAGLTVWMTYYAPTNRGSGGNA